MSSPIVKLPGQPLAHMPGVPVEYLEMGQDVAGLAGLGDNPSYAGEYSNLPPETMLIEQSATNYRYMPKDYLPPELGVREIPRIVSATDLLPTEKEVSAQENPGTQDFHTMEVVMPRSTFTDTYPAIPSMDTLQPDAGAEDGIYSTFIGGSLGNLGEDVAPTDSLSQAIAQQKARNRAFQNPLKTAVEVFPSWDWVLAHKMELGVVGLSAILAYRYLRRR